MSGASHIDGANPIGRVKNGNGQLSTERQDRMMVDAWSVDHDATSRVFVCSCSLLSFIVVQVPRCVPGYSCASGRRGCRTVQGVVRVRSVFSGGQGTDPAIPRRSAGHARQGSSTSCSASSETRRTKKKDLQRTAETPTEPARAL